MSAGEVVSIILAGIAVMFLYLAVDALFGRKRDEDDKPWWTPWR